MKNLAILIPSCDAYADTWQPFFHFFWKHWPDCPFDVYLGTNHEDFNDPRVRIIKVGDDVSWADNMNKMLTIINAPYVLLFLDDYFIYRCTPAKIMEAFDAFRKLNARYMQLTPTPRPNRKVPGYPMLGEIQKGARYRTAIGIEFWDVNTLLSLLKEGESAWDMEAKGSERAKDLDGFYRTWKPVVGVHNAIVRKRWQRRAVSYCRRNGVPVDISIRSVFSVSETAWTGIKSFIRRTISRLPEPVFIQLFLLGRKTLNLFSPDTKKQVRKS